MIKTVQFVELQADDLTRSDATRIVRLIDRAIPVLRGRIVDRYAEDGVIIQEDDRRIIEAIVAEVVGS